MPEAIEVGLGLTGTGGPGGPDPGGGWANEAAGLMESPMCLTCFTESSLLERVLDLEPALVSAPLELLLAKLAMPDSPVGGLIES